MFDSLYSDAKGILSPTSWLPPVLCVRPKHAQVSQWTLAVRTMGVDTVKRMYSYMSIVTLTTFHFLISFHAVSYPVFVFSAIFLFFFFFLHPEIFLKKDFCSHIFHFKCILCLLCGSCTLLSSFPISREPLFSPLFTRRSSGGRPALLAPPFLHRMCSFPPFDQET